MRRFTPDIIRRATITTTRTPIIREKVECFGQFIKINDTLWNINKINDIKMIKLSDGVTYLSISSDREEEGKLYMNETEDATVIFDDICSKIKRAKHLQSYQ